MSLLLRNCKLKLMAFIITAMKIPFTYLKCSAGKCSRMIPCAPGYSSSLMKSQFFLMAVCTQTCREALSSLSVLSMINLCPHQTACCALSPASQQIIFLAFKPIYDLVDVLIVSLNLASQRRLCHRAGN